MYEPIRKVDNLCGERPVWLKGRIWTALDGRRWVAVWLERPGKPIAQGWLRYDA